MFRAEMDRPRWSDCMASTVTRFNATQFFSVGGHMKSMVYQTLVDTVEDLLAQVLDAAQEIQQGGRHIEPLL